MTSDPHAELPAIVSQELQTLRNDNDSMIALMESPNSKITTKKVEGPSMTGTNMQTSTVGRVELGPKGELLQTVDPKVITGRIPLAETMRLMQQAEQSSALAKEASDSEEDHESVPQQLSVEEITRLHEAHSLEKLQPIDSKMCINQVASALPVGDLYDLLAASNYSTDAPFCGVLLKMQNKYIREDESLPFLLQIWDRKGTMIFEKNLAEPVANWNMIDDKFVWQEKENSKNIFVIQLFNDRRPAIHEIQLPLNLIETPFSQTPLNIEFQEQSHQAKANSPEQVRKNKMKRDASVGFNVEEAFEQARAQKEVYTHRRQGINSSIYKQSQIKPGDDFETILKKITSEDTSKKIIYRAPAKMLDLRNGQLVVCWAHKIIYVDISELLKTGEQQNYETDHATIKYDASRDTNMNETNRTLIINTQRFTEDQVKVIELDKQVKIITMHSIVQKNVSCIVTEDMRTRVIRFMSLEMVKEPVPGDPDQPDMTLKVHQLGQQEQVAIGKLAPLRKFRHALKTTPQGQYYHMAIVLREDGKVEFYSDFKRVSNFYSQNHPCVDIATSRNYFYIKTVNTAHVQKKNYFDTEDPQLFDYMKFNHSWRSKLDASAAKEFFNDEEWNRVKHTRAANHCRLITNYKNFGTFLICAHRNMISVYDMLQKKWRKPMKFPEWIRDIHLSRTRELATPDLSEFQKYAILAFSGTNSIDLISLRPSGELVHTRSLTPSIGGQRIIELEYGGNSLAGSMTFKTDSGVVQPFQILQRDQMDRVVVKLHNYSLLKCHTNPEFHINSFVEEKMFHLMSSTESIGKNLLSYNTQFSVFQMNSDVFIDTKEADRLIYERQSHGETIEQIRETVSPREDPIVYMRLTSDFNVMYFEDSEARKLIIVPYLREEDDDHMVVKEFLATDFVKSLEIDHELGIGEDLINVFALNSHEFKESKNSLVRLTRQNLTIFDPEMRLRLKYTNLECKNGVNIDERYMYTIQDPQTKALFKYDYRTRKSEMCKSKGSGSGLHIYNLKSLAKGNLEFYKLMKSMSGENYVIDKSKFMDRYSFLQDYNRLVMIPFFHLNLLNFIGMRNKHNYIVWREKNGFFTALDNRGFLTTWSIPVGNIVYSQQVSGALNGKSIETPRYFKESWLDEYSVYRSSERDISHTKNYENHKYCSRQLLVSRQSVVEMLKAKQEGKKFDPITIQDIERSRKQANDLELKNESGIGDDGQDGSLTANFMKCKKMKLNIETWSAEEDFDLYIFKVLELTTFEDNKQRSEVKVKFKFTHPMIRAEKVDDHLDWKLSHKPEQRLYISPSTQYMLEIINNFKTTIYEREMNNDTEVHWKVKQQIRRTPRLLVGLTTANYMFSPEFNYMIDYMPKMNTFVVRDIQTDEVVVQVPEEMLSKCDTTLIEQIRVQASKITFVTESMIRVINRYDLDCHLEIVDDDTKPKRPSGRPAKKLKLLSSTKLDNFLLNKKKLTNNHCVHDISLVSMHETLLRLIRTNQQFKSAQAYLKIDKKSDINMFEQIFRIDYDQPWDDEVSQFDAETTFTLLDWIIMDKMMKNQDFKTETINQRQKLNLALNIFPLCQSFLHKLAIGNTTQSKKRIDQLHVVEQVKKIYNACSLGFDILQMDPIEIPFMQDFKGKTPLHYCIGIQRQVKPWCQHAFQLKSNFAENFKDDSTNTPMASAMLQKMQDYSFMHAGEPMVDSISCAIEAGIPGIGEYMDGRMKIGKYLQESSLRVFREELHQEGAGRFCDYGFINQVLWIDQEKTSKRMFETEGHIRPMKQYIIDLPMLHTNTSEGLGFMEALASSDNIDLFSHPSVQVLIDYQWTRWSNINFKIFQLPLVLRMVAFLIWSNILLPNISNEHWDVSTVTYVVEIIIIAISFYLFLLETIEISYLGARKYVSNFTNIIQLLSLALPIFNIVRAHFFLYNMGKDEMFWRVNAWTALLMWFGFLLFLKSIMKFSYLIHMIENVIIDMLPFMSILVFCIIAFADSFSSIREILVLQGLDVDIERDTTSFYGSFVTVFARELRNSYATALGEFGFQEAHMLYSEADWLLWLICTLFNLIIMLNLLIAIISKTFEHVDSTAVEHQYKEKASQAVSISHVYSRQIASDPSEVLLVVKTLKGAEIFQNNKD